VRRNHSDRGEEGRDKGADLGGNGRRSPFIGGEIVKHQDHSWALGFTLKIEDSRKCWGRGG